MTLRGAISAEIDVSLFKQMKRLMSEYDLTTSELIEKALRYWIKDYGDSVKVEFDFDLNHYKKISQLRK